MVERKHPVNVVFADTETTGLDEDDHCVIQLGVVKVEFGLRDPLDMKVLYEWERKLVLPEGFEVDDYARKLNGYSEEVWAVEGRDRRESYIQFLSMLEWSSFGGQNPCFDWRHINADLKRLGLSLPRMANYSLFSVDGLARPLTLANLLQNVKQETMLAFFGMEKQQHDALSDIRQAVQIYKKLLFLFYHGLSDETIQDAIDLEPVDMTPTEMAPGER